MLTILKSPTECPVRGRWCRRRMDVPESVRSRPRSFHGCVALRLAQAGVPVLHVEFWPMVFCLSCPFPVLILKPDTQNGEAGLSSQTGTSQFSRPTIPSPKTGISINITSCSTMHLIRLGGLINQAHIWRSGLKTQATQMWRRTRIPYQLGRGQKTRN